MQNSLMREIGCAWKEGIAQTRVFCLAIVTWAAANAGKMWNPTGNSSVIEHVMVHILKDI